MRRKDTERRKWGQQERKMRGGKGEGGEKCHEKEGKKEEKNRKSKCQQRFLSNNRSLKNKVILM